MPSELRCNPIQRCMIMICRSLGSPDRGTCHNVRGRGRRSIVRILCLNCNGQRQVKGIPAIPFGLKDKGNAILSCNFLAGAEWSAGIGHFKDCGSGIVIPAVSTFHSALGSFPSCPIDRGGLFRGLASTRGTYIQKSATMDFLYTQHKTDVNTNLMWKLILLYNIYTYNIFFSRVMYYFLCITFFKLVYKVLD